MPIISVRRVTILKMEKITIIQTGFEAVPVMGVDRRRGGTRELPELWVNI